MVDFDVPASAGGLRRRTVMAAMAGLVLPLPVAGATAGRPASVRAGIPTPVEVLGIGFGDRVFTVEETARYLSAVAASSPHVIESTVGTSWSGTPIPYAVVGAPDRVTDRALERIRGMLAALRDPGSPTPVVDVALRDCPALVWIGAGVHGNEPSGTNAALSTLYDLAARTGPEAEAILGAVLVVIVPVQNPDGHADGERGNFYGFDLNRDWFAATQAETIGKLCLLADYPPVALLDMHEMQGDGFFFPPYREPVHHEVPAVVRRALKDLYGPAMATAFREQGFDFTSGTGFDLNYPGQSDTAAAVSGLAAGITLEKGAASTVADRVEEHSTAAWAALAAVAARRRGVLRSWHAAHVEAADQGRRGTVQGVPGARVRHYFLSPVDGPMAIDQQRLIHRLQLSGVTVRRLTRRHDVTDLRAFGGTPRPGSVEAGTYWIPLAQGRKHWAQTMLSDTSHPTGTTFSDATCWSLPLFANLPGGCSGRRQRFDSEPCALVPRPEPGLPEPSLRIGILRMSPPVLPIGGSLGWLLYRVQRVWNAPFVGLSPFDVAPERLAEIDVLLTPDGDVDFCYERLGEGGRAALRDWVAGGGRFVGWRAALQLAVRLGLSAIHQSAPTFEIAGAMVRVVASPGSPMVAGVGRTPWSFCQREPVVHAADPAHVVMAFPPADSPQWFVSGFHIGAQRLAGSAAVTGEPFGGGSVVLLAGEPDFRGLGDGMMTVVRNVVTGASPTGPSPAGAAGAGLIQPPSVACRVTVRAGDETATAAALSAHRFVVRPNPCAGSATTFEVVAPALEAVPTRLIPDLLRAAGVAPLAVVLG